MEGIPASWPSVTARAVTIAAIRKNRISPPNIHVNPFSEVENMYNDLTCYDTIQRSDSILAVEFRRRSRRGGGDGSHHRERRLAARCRAQHSGEGPTGGGVGSVGQ